MAARGEVWWTDLGPPRGSAPAYRHPVVVVSSDSFNQSRIGTVIIVVVTSNLRLADARGNVFLERGIANLPDHSVANVSQVVTIDKDDLGDRIGILPPDLMKQIDDGLRLALSL